MAKQGRPSELTPETVQKLVNAFRAGADRKAAAGKAGIGRSTFNAWMKKGRRQRRGEFRDFLDTIEQAESDFEVDQLAIIATAARGQAPVAATANTPGRPGVDRDWKAAAFLLQHNPRARKRYGKNTTVKIQGDKNAPVAFFTLDIPHPNPNGSQRSEAQDAGDDEE